MTSVIYLTDAADETYKDEAFGYVFDWKQDISGDKGDRLLYERRYHRHSAAVGISGRGDTKALNGSRR
nr:hypothetical protein [uncultured Desulfuromonas sp.]